MITFAKPEFTHLDARGRLTQLVSQGWAQVNVIQSDAGTVRGDHWHEHNREMFFCVYGRFKLTLQKDSNVETHDIETGALFIVEPRVRHTFEYHENTVIVALYDLGVQLGQGRLDIHN